MSRVVADAAPKSEGSDPRSFAGRPPSSSGLLGQILTPPLLASRMAELLLRSRPSTAIRILDPCVGPGVFPDALEKSGRLQRDDRITGVDIDPTMIEQACGRSQLDAVLADFLRWTPPFEFDFTILNPPYVRQEWIDDKAGLINHVESSTGLRVPGGANLYAYFLIKSIACLRPGGKFVALVYDSWRHTRYGQWLQRQLGQRCSHVRAEDVPDAPFDGRLIDATIISGCRSARGAQARKRPSLRAGVRDLLPGVTPIDTQYATTRGLRLKQTSFFLCDRRQADAIGATPFVKRVRHVRGFSVSHDHPEAALLVEPGHVDHPAVPELRVRLEGARRDPDNNVAILTWAKERPDRWWSHRRPPVAPILLNYFLRGRPKHVLNPSLPFSDNFYGIVPRDGSNAKAHLAALNGTAAVIGLLAQSRSQGAGLRKVQLFEYRSALVPDLRGMDSGDFRALAELGDVLARGRSRPENTIRRIDELLACSLAVSELSHGALVDMLDALLLEL